jgi:hypothetical protein
VSLFGNQFSEKMDSRYLSAAVTGKIERSDGGAAGKARQGF